jgi:hypothetical protein
MLRISEATTQQQAEAQVKQVIDRCSPRSILPKGDRLE